MTSYNLCFISTYEKKLGKLDDGFFILANMDAKLCFAKIIMIFLGKWKLHWPKPTYQTPWNFILLGQMLECSDWFHMFLTLSLFPSISSKSLVFLNVMHLVIFKIDLQQLIAFSHGNEFNILNSYCSLQPTHFCW